MVFFSAALIVALAGPVDFDAEKSGALTVESMGKSVAALIGDCSKADFEDAMACEKNLAAQSKALRSKSQYIDMGPVEDGTLQYVGPQRNGETRLLWVPIMDADGYGLSLKKPMGLTKDGRPKMKKLVLDAKLPSGMFPSELQRAVRLSMVNVEVVGRFGRTWTLKKGQHQKQGVVFKATHVRLTNTRNGKTLAVIKL